MLNEVLGRIRSLGKVSAEEEGEVDSGVAYKHPDLVETISTHQLIYSIVALLVGTLCILGGLGLFFAGISGEITWTTDVMGAKSELLNAAPGAVLFIVGLFVVIFSRYSMKVR